VSQKALLLQSRAEREMLEDQENDALINEILMRLEHVTFSNILSLWRLLMWRESQEPQKKTYSVRSAVCFILTDT
jgi:hypothetical protein